MRPSIHLHPMNHEDDNSSSSSVAGPRNSASEPLLEDGLEWRSSAGKQSNWSERPLHEARSRGRRRASLQEEGPYTEKMPLRRRIGGRRCLIFGLGLLIILGIVQLLSLLGNLIVLTLPNGVEKIISQWGRPGHIGAGLTSWPTDFSRDILPIPCHSHNDYWRNVPLFSAIEAGCIGVEADIWLFAEKLYVGHSIASLTPNRTLNSLYINPLLDILGKQNPKALVATDPDRTLHGVFDTTPEQSLIFLIDFKTSGSALWPYMYAALEPLRSKGYLTHLNGSEIVQGPITVVGTGNTPFDMIISPIANPHRDVFFDSPLDQMYEAPNGETSPPLVQRSPSSLHSQREADEGGQGSTGTPGDSSAFTVQNSYYASVAFGKAIGNLWNGEFSDTQLEMLRGQVRGAHRRGLKARYWDLPFWPINLRNHVWDVLVREGVDLLNVDDLKGATKSNWKKNRGWWRRMKGSGSSDDTGVQSNDAQE